MSDILVTPAQLSATAAGLRTRAVAIQSCLETVDAQVGRLGPDEFSGRRADALRDRYTASRAGIFEFPQLLLNYAHLLETGAEAFAAADRGGAVPQ